MANIFLIFNSLKCFIGLFSNSYFWLLLYINRTISRQNERLCAWSARKIGISNIDKWAELRTAYQLAKLGTFNVPANALGLHRTTVNRHIGVSEKQMGARIFIRQAWGYTLTELGEDVLRVAQKAEKIIEDLTVRLQGKKALLRCIRSASHKG